MFPSSLPSTQWHVMVPTVSHLPQHWAFLMPSLSGLNFCSSESVRHNLIVALTGVSVGLNLASYICCPFKSPENCLITFFFYCPPCSLLLAFNFKGVICIFFFFFFTFLVTSSLKDNLHTIQFTRLKCTIQWPLVYSQSWVSITKSILEAISRIPENFH